MRKANYTVLTLQQPDIENFAQARNNLLDTAKTDWVFFLDADEELTKTLSEEIEIAIQSPDFASYRVHRQDIFLGQVLRHGENASNSFIRLVKKGSGKWVRPVHEVWETQEDVGELTSPLIHHIGDIASFVAKINNYSEIEATYRKTMGIHSSLFHIGVFPFAKFKYNYFVRLGILDGVPGTIMAILMSFHSYLTWTKLYLLWHKK